MNNPKQIWFEIWGEAQAQNVFLKGVLVLFTVILLTETIALIAISLRAPLVFVSSEKSTHSLADTSPTDAILIAEATRVISNYIKLHHDWSSATISDNFHRASALISPRFIQDFKTSTATQTQIAKNKGLSQRFFISASHVDPTKRIATISGHRLLKVGTLYAASEMKINVSYELGARTQTNPEGVYVTSETLLNESKKDE